MGLSRKKGVPAVGVAAPLDLSLVLAQPIDWQYKAFPMSGEPVQIGAAGDRGWNALQPPFSPPVMVLKDSALQHNIETMSEYGRAHSLSLAPHAKTPLSPQIAARQLAAGAWGLTVANVHQARVLRSVGVQRLFLANEVVDPVSASWLAGEINQDPDLETYCLVDSVQGARLLHEYLAGAGLGTPLAVLIEFGIAGGRCGCRSMDEAFQLADTVADLHRLRLVGVEGYENIFPPGPIDQTIQAVDQFFDCLRELATQLDTDGLLESTQEILVSGGGSMWFDRAVARLSEPWGLSRPVRTLIRAGSYVTHDAADYERFSPLDGRASGPPKLEQALELWASIISRPEPDLAILNFGKRDAAHDRGLPTPFMARTKQGNHRLQPEEHVIFALNDQHARLRLSSSSALAVGDLVGSYVSHPCTSFDKWRLVPLVNDHYDVLGAIRSYL